MAGRVMFYVQHLLGIGHVRRAAVLSRAMAGAGLEVSAVLGGRDVPGVDFAAASVHRLSPASVADAAFKPLLGEDGKPVDDAWKGRRREALLAHFKSIEPDVLLFELFPFGRRMFRFELIDLLQAAHARTRRPLIVSSVRDVLVERPDQKRNREMAELARQWFDLVLVHGDPNLIPFEASFPPAHSIAAMIRYTGYVAEPTADIPSSTEGAGEVVVSVGGGALGEELLRCALAARPLGRLAGAKWRLLAGPNLGEEAFASLCSEAPPGVTVERTRPDFPALLSNCALSISQGGYNTVIDVLRAGAKAVVVPVPVSESEQTFRARLLAERGLVGMVEAGRLTPENLARAADAAVDARRGETHGIDFSGAETTADIISNLAKSVYNGSKEL